jgi:3-oxoacyl-[acyl-carrier-protein] synthase-3
MDIGIKSIGLYLPSQLVDLRELDDYQQLSEEERGVFDMVLEGMSTVAVEGELNAVGMLTRAGKEALDKAGLEGKDLSAIVLAGSRAPEYLMSSEATHLQYELGMPNGFAMTVSELGCANISVAMKIGAQLARESGGNVLVACASAPCGGRRYRRAVTVVGDAATAIILGQSDSDVLLGAEVQTDGKYWDLFKVAYQNSAQWVHEEAQTDARYKFELAMKTRNIYRELNERLLGKCSLELADSYMMQNLAVSAFQYNEEALQIKFAASCRENCARYGHLGGVDVILNYASAKESGEIKQGDTVLVQNNSPVACWTSVLLRV